MAATAADDAWTATARCGRTAVPLGMSSLQQGRNPAGDLGGRLDSMGSLLPEPDDTHPQLAAASSAFLRG
ncbi:MAG: hypothetical protein QOI36_1822 [Pseudonocardiales bacterium]|nr:hypothetical protein [Pseudonocardiales bacterium]